MTPTLLQRLKIALPIVQAPMAGADSPALAAAVSQAGGLGMLGCGMRSPAAMADAAAQVRALTDTPFGMNLFVQATPTPSEAVVRAAMNRLAPLYAQWGLTPEVPKQWCEDFPAQFDALLTARPAVASFTFGILSAAQVAQLHAAGCCVIGTATTVEEARAWAHVGADAVCASGMEGGGHRGSFLKVPRNPDLDGLLGRAPTRGSEDADDDAYAGTYSDALSPADYAASMLSTLALVPQCVDALRIPVLAAGGIMDGRGIAAALALGAQAVQMGTAFLACPESAIHPLHRQALSSATGTDTRSTRIFSGRPARGIVNAMMQQLAGDENAVPAYPVQNALTAPLRRAAAMQDKASHLSLWAGQGVAAVRPMPAAQLVRVLEQEWRAAAAAAAGAAAGTALPVAAGEVQALR